MKNQSQMRAKLLWLLAMVSALALALPAQASSDNPPEGNPIHGDHEGKIIIIEKTISGTVTDAEDGGGLPGVNILAKGTTIGTITDIEGRYSLSVPDETQTLVFSSVGYQTREIDIDGRSTIDLALAPDVQALSEVVVVGYGTVKRSDLTGSVGSVNGEELNTVAQPSVDQALQGRVAGVRITQTNAEPGGGFSVRIRGTNSITAGNEPLYVVDGLPGTNPLNSLNPSDIESVEVLKDASATAIYGARGSNGVVIITTKQGRRESPLSVNYNVSVGLQAPTKTLDMMNTQEYMTFYNDLFADRGNPAPFSQADINAIGEGTDWQDAVLQTGTVQDHRLSFSGGSRDTQYYLSLAYFDQNGIILNSGFNRISGRINLIHSISDKLEVGINFNNSIENKESVRIGTGVNVGAGVVGAALQLPPTDPIYDENGDFAFSLQDLTNPVGQAETIEDLDNAMRMFGNSYLNYKILDNLSARVNLGFSRRNTEGSFFFDTQTLLGQLNEGEATKSFRNNTDYLIEFTSQYDPDFGDDHSLSILGGFGYQRFVNSNFSASARNFSSTAFGYNNLGAGEAAQNLVNSNKQENTIVSGFARLNYNILDRYLLTGTFRADGSSRFGENNKVAYFPSGALAWRISNESFFPETEFIEDLKLRASIGISGNQEIGNGNSQILLGRGPVAVLDGIELESIAPIQLANPDLRWETTQSFNVGVDMSFLAGRINGSIEYFKNTTRDLLLALPVPTTTGFGTSLQNVGDTENSGFEFNVVSRNLTGELSWTTNFNFATLNNEVVSLGELPRILQGGVRFLNDFTLLQPGVPMNSYFGYEYAGVFQSESDISSSPTQANSYVGGRKFRDINGDGTITPEDRTVLGNPFPDLTLGLNNVFRYKGFQLEIFFEGRFGYELANVTNIDSENPIDDLRNRQRYVLDRWTPSNTNTDVPSFISPSRTFDFNSRVIEDASFLRLRNFRMAYSFPGLENEKITGLTVYLAGQNLLTFTDYRGYNPDINVFGSSNTVVDYAAYPLARTYSLGVDFKF
jgi:TonB-linked SusC/RagA family outer membrane protein